jgi:F-type H+-transporting ATPase subunit gamma
MSSLKEIKGRISSVKSTQKITSAMKMVASAKLRKAQSNIERFLPYQKRLADVLQRFVASGAGEIASSLTEIRRPLRVAVVALSSNSSLCGAFNSNVIKLLVETVAKYHAMGCEIDIYPVGKKVEEAVRKLDLTAGVAGSYIQLIDKPVYDDASMFADSLIAAFVEKRIDCVEVLYNHFKNPAVQVTVSEQFLPIVLPVAEGKTVPTDYIIEPDRATILNTLLPKSLRAKFFAVLLDSAAAEQAARTMAMQIATDNADDILTDLGVQFNKQRQQAITSELLDIVGGSEALK